MAEAEKWSKPRACLLPLSMVITFFYLFGFLQDDTGNRYLFAGLLAMVPGAFLSLYLWFCTFKTSAQPNILTAFSFLAFLMSIAWINWTSNCVVDLIVIFGFITKLP